MSVENGTWTHTQAASTSVGLDPDPDGIQNNDYPRPFVNLYIMAKCPLVKFHCSTALAHNTQLSCFSI